jgi:hypothetical protein
MATDLFSARAVDGDSASHAIVTDITTIVAHGEPWGNVRLQLEISADGGEPFVPVSDWYMTAPGSKNVLANGSGGLYLRLQQYGSNDTPDTPPSISAKAV